MDIKIPIEATNLSGTSIKADQNGNYYLNMPFALRLIVKIGKSNDKYFLHKNY